MLSACPYEKPSKIKQQVLDERAGNAVSNQAGSSSAKNPILKQHKSSLQPAKPNPKPSKAERLKNRLASKCPPPSKERLNEMMIQSNWSSLSSSSGVGSSTRSSFESNISNTVHDEERNRANHELQSGGRCRPAEAADIYRLCQCQDCRLSGQEIYSRRPDPNPASRKTVVVPPYQAGGRFAYHQAGGPNQTRKAVSFRSNVEQIGSHDYRLLNDVEVEPQFQSYYDNWPPKDDSCDSLHVTKDLSLSVSVPGEPRDDDDYLHPRDCSTPKQALTVDPPQFVGSGERVLKAEVYSRGPTKVLPPANNRLFAGDYTCLCSPDFVCVHNNNQPAAQPKPASNRRKKPPSPSSAAAARGPYGLSGVMPAQTLAGGNFSLSDDCYECKNMSTYVNLSRSGQQPSATQADVSAASNGGYGSQEYKRLIRSKQGYVYANWQQENNEQPLANNEDQHINYMSAARRIQQAIEECEMCKEQLRVQNGNAEQLQCNCPLGNQPPQMSLQEGSSESSKQRDLSGLTISRSYHTASSSLPGSVAVPKGANLRADPALANLSELSVLPVSTVSSRLEHPNGISASKAMMTSQQQPQQNGFMDSSANAANIDSSLSSLFVYRHMSDDNQPQMGLDEFDPDSLEITVNKSANNNGLNSKPAQSQQPGSSWLKSRPKSEYISLSSTTSSNLSNARVPGAAANGKSGYLASAINSRPSSSSKGPQLMQVDSDLTQSSLAKRRQLSNSLQQQQQQQQSAQKQPKKKLLASKSSTDLSQSALSGRLSRSSSATNTAGNPTNVKAIYQCVKNHLLDITKSSNASSSTTGKSSINNSSGTISTSAATLPRNFTTGKSRSSKSAQVCMLPNFKLNPFAPFQPITISELSMLCGYPITNLCANILLIRWKSFALSSPNATKSCSP